MEIRLADFSGMEFHAYLRRQARIRGIQKKKANSCSLCPSIELYLSLIQHSLGIFYLSKNISIQKKSHVFLVFLISLLCLNIYYVKGKNHLKRCDGKSKDGKNNCN